MTQSIVNFPVVCPECGSEAIAALAIAFAAEALIQGKTIRLHSTCHDKWWDASRVEVEQLREYISAVVSFTQPEKWSSSKNEPHLQLVTG